MLGTGTWHLKIGNMFYSGDITLRVFDDGGKYGSSRSYPGWGTARLAEKGAANCS